MPTDKRPLKVFLCHAHADRDAVRTLYMRLTNDGVDAWLDKEKLLPGQDWELEIKKAVREADVVMFCLSKQFNQAGFRQKEVRLALDTAMEKPEGEIFIIPARLEECENLESLRKWHWVDLYEEDGYEKLLRALYAHGEQIGAITYSLRKSDLLAERARQISFLRSQAVKLEDDLEWSTALELYRQIRQLDSKTTGVDDKIAELMRKTQAQQLDASKQNKTANPLSGYAIPGLSFFILCCLFVFVGGGWYAWNNGLIGVTPVETLVVQETYEITATPPLVQTETVDANPIAFSEDGMVLISAGKFMMGSENGNDDEKPIHQVYLDAYYIDMHEVTNGFYKKCVDAGKCPSPLELSSGTRSSYFGNSQYDEYPVIYVNWNMAMTYCEWRGARLPSEAEWEKAARGTDGKTFPWGEKASCDKANYDNCIGDTTKVGDFFDDLSPYHVYDMAGNVWEWVADWYDEDYYANSTSLNPKGPISGEYRVIRGGALDENVEYIRSASRGNLMPNEAGDVVGFRCAMDAP